MPAEFSNPHSGEHARKEYHPDLFLEQVRKDLRAIDVPHDQLRAPKAIVRDALSQVPDEEMLGAVLDLESDLSKYLHDPLRRPPDPRDAAARTYLTENIMRLPFPHEEVGDADTVALRDRYITQVQEHQARESYRDFNVQRDRAKNMASAVSSNWHDIQDGNSTTEMSEGYIVGLWDTLRLSLAEEGRIEKTAGQIATLRNPVDQNSGQDPRIEGSANVSQWTHTHNQAMASLREHRGQPRYQLLVAVHQLRDVPPKVLTDILLENVFDDEEKNKIRSARETYEKAEASVSESEGFKDHKDDRYTKFRQDHGTVREDYVRAAGVLSRLQELLIGKDTLPLETRETLRDPDRRVNVGANDVERAKFTFLGSIIVDVSTVLLKGDYPQFQSADNQ